MDSPSVGSIRRSACLSFPSPGAACAQSGEASWGQAGPDPESWAGMCDVSSSFPPIPRTAFTHRDQDPLEDKDRAVWRGMEAARCPLYHHPMGQGVLITQHRSPQHPGWARHLLHHQDGLMWNCPGGEPTRVPPLTPDGEARAFFGCSALAQPSPHTIPLILFGPDPPWCIAHLQAFPSHSQTTSPWASTKGCGDISIPAMPQKPLPCLLCGRGTRLRACPQPGQK